ncbi:hypothetical protein [Magnetovibrio sp.]|uniref:hypothetical protein n=1 Tax=Magnetovibrio sp. TaxID=2024836 RepID=UPI002F953E5C
MPAFIDYITIFAFFWVISAISCITAAFAFNVVMRFFDKNQRLTYGFAHWLGAATFMSATWVYVGSAGNEDWVSAIFFAAIMYAMIYLYVATFRLPKIPE